MCAVRVTLCVSGIVRAVHQSSSKLGDTPLARLDLFESLPSRRFGCRASTTNSTTKSRSTSLYNGGASSRGGCRALQLYSAPERSTSLQLYSALHSTSSTPSLRSSVSMQDVGGTCSSTSGAPSPPASPPHHRWNVSRARRSTPREALVVDAAAAASARAQRPGRDNGRTSKHA